METFVSWEQRKRPVFVHLSILPAHLLDEFDDFDDFDDSDNFDDYDDW